MLCTWALGERLIQWDYGNTGRGRKITFQPFPAQSPAAYTRLFMVPAYF